MKVRYVWGGYKRKKYLQSNDVNGVKESEAEEEKKTVWSGVICW